VVSRRKSVSFLSTVTLRLLPMSPVYVLPISPAAHTLRRTGNGKFCRCTTTAGCDSDQQNPMSPHSASVVWVDVTVSRDRACRTFMAPSASRRLSRRPD
jgi:hypothetical protein